MPEDRCVRARGAAGVWWPSLSLHSCCWGGTCFCIVNLAVVRSCVEASCSSHRPFIYSPHQPVFLNILYASLILPQAHPSHFFPLHPVPILLCKEKQSLVTCSMRPKCVVCVRVRVPEWLERNELCFGMLTTVSRVR